MKRIVLILTIGALFIYGALSADETTWHNIWRLVSSEWSHPQIHLINLHPADPLGPGGVIAFIGLAGPNLDWQVPAAQINGGFIDPKNMKGDLDLIIRYGNQNRILALRGPEEALMPNVAGFWNIGLPGAEMRTGYFTEEVNAGVFQSPNMPWNAARLQGMNGHTVSFKWVWPPGHLEVYVDKIYIGKISQ